MGIFSKKTKISVRDWCERFYTDYVFTAAIGETDPWRIFCESTQAEIAKSDPAFASVDSSSLSDQLLALRLEVVGVAWTVNLKDEFAPVQSECTRLYLQNCNRQRTWDLMEVYNQAVAKSTVGGVDSGTESGREHVQYMNSWRAQMFDRWVERVSDPVDAARAANRLGCDVSWNLQRVHVYLSFALTDQLGCEVNEEARIGMMATIQGFFDGASDELKQVKVIS